MYVYMMHMHVCVSDAHARIHTHPSTSIESACCKLAHLCLPVDMLCVQSFLGLVLLKFRMQIEALASVVSLPFPGKMSRNWGLEVVVLSLSRIDWQPTSRM